MRHIKFILILAGILNFSSICYCESLEHQADISQKINLSDSESVSVEANKINSVNPSKNRYDYKVINEKFGLHSSFEDMSDSYLNINEETRKQQDYVNKQIEQEKD